MVKSQIVLPGSRKRKWASGLIKLRHQPPIIPTAQINDSITVVCVSDTHGKMPRIPEADLLLHAGDMTEWGSFDEIQAQLSWLSSQPHRYKVVIAGNHDVLLDDEYMAKNAQTNRLPWERQDHASRSDLDFGSCIYLENRSVALDFSGRTLNIYGSPITPKSAGNSAFQVTRETWSTDVPAETDIVLSHGPPFRHLDEFPHAGCVDLLQNIIRVRPRPVVCGHIHVSYGREDVVFDQLGSDYEGIMAGWYGYEAVLRMILSLLWSRFCQFIVRMVGKPDAMNEVTTLINAAVVSGPENDLTKEPITVRI